MQVPTNTDPANQSRRLVAWVIRLAVALLPVLIYAQTLSYGFYLDDYDRLLGPRLTFLDLAGDVSSRGLQTFRPIPYLVMNRWPERLHFDPRPMRTVFLAVFSLTGFCLVVLLERLGLHPFPRLAGSLFFVLSSIHVKNISWFVQFNQILFDFCFLCMLLLYTTRFRETWRVSLCFTIYLATVFLRENFLFAWAGILALLWTRGEHRSSRLSLALVGAMGAYALVFASVRFHLRDQALPHLWFGLGSHVFENLSKVLDVHFFNVPNTTALSCLAIPLLAAKTLLGPLRRLGVLSIAIALAFSVPMLVLFREDFDARRLSTAWIGVSILLAAWFQASGDRTWKSAAAGLLVACGLTLSGAEMYWEELVPDGYLGRASATLARELKAACASGDRLRLVGCPDLPPIPEQDPMLALGGMTGEGKVLDLYCPSRDAAEISHPAARCLAVRPTGLTLPCAGCGCLVALEGADLPEEVSTVRSRQACFTSGRDSSISP